MQICIINTDVFGGGLLEMDREISSGIGKQKEGVLSAQHPKDLSSIYILPNTHSAPQSKHRAKTRK